MRYEHYTVTETHRLLFPLISWLPTLTLCMNHKNNASTTDTLKTDMQNEKETIPHHLWKVINMEKAIDEYLKGGKTYEELAKKYNIPRSTLQTRYPQCTHLNFSYIPMFPSSANHHISCVGLPNVRLCVAKTKTLLKDILL